MNSNTTLFFDAYEAIEAAKSIGAFNIGAFKIGATSLKDLPPIPQFYSGARVYSLHSQGRADEYAVIKGEVYYILRNFVKGNSPGDVAKIFGKIKYGDDGKTYYKDMRDGLGEWKELIMPQSGGYRKKHRSTRRGRKSHRSRKTHHTRKH